ncbi:MAG: hypothetical protein V2A74_10860 [bacterium]
MTPPILSLAMLLLVLNIAAVYLYLRLRSLNPADASPSRRGAERQRRRHKSIEPLGRLLRLLGLAAKSRPISHTPAEFVLCRAAMPQSARTLVEEYIGSYYSWRYADLVASERGSVEKRMNRLLGQLAEILKRARATDPILGPSRHHKEKNS